MRPAEAFYANYMFLYGLCLTSRETAGGTPELCPEYAHACQVLGDNLLIFCPLRRVHYMDTARPYQWEVGSPKPWRLSF